MNALGSESEYIDGLAAYKGGDYKTAIEMWTKAAAQRNADAQFGLGGMYHNGHGVTQDYNQALSWYRKAANQRNAEAQFNLGLMYAKGQGVEQDDNQALLWFRKAADQGQAEAQCALGLVYQNGQGVAQDYSQAVLWYRKAAVKGNSMAQSNLGSMYHNGRGVTQDNIEALKWFMLAAAYETDEVRRDTVVISRGIVAKELTSAEIAEGQKRAVVDPMFHPSVANVIRRVIEHRKELRADLEKLCEKHVARPKDIERDLKPEEKDEIRKNFLLGLARLPLGVKYAETMGRLDRFVNDNVTKENPTLPKVEWWLRLNKLFEIEESFYKQIRGAVAENNLQDIKIYSGLAKEALHQIWDSIEEAGSPTKPTTEKQNVSNSPKTGRWKRLVKLLWD